MVKRYDMALFIGIKTVQG